MRCDKCGEDCDPFDIVDSPLPPYSKICAECADDMDEVVNETKVMAYKPEA